MTARISHLQNFEPLAVEPPHNIGGYARCPRCRHTLHAEPDEPNVAVCICGYRFARDAAPLNWQTFHPRYNIDWAEVKGATGIFTRRRPACTNQHRGGDCGI